jgi:hypothetical protein
MEQSINSKPVLISSRALMGMIGLLGFLIPLIVFFVSIIIGDCDSIQSSISAYYHTNARDIFVGMICALAFAFFAYKGYREKAMINDMLIGNLAAVFALGVAFFPTSVSAGQESNCAMLVDTGIYGVVHYVSAILLFITLAYFAIFQFTKNEKGSSFIKGRWNELSDSKKNDNIIYIICGSLIILCIVLAGVYLAFLPNALKDSIARIKPIFILETIMLWSFSYAWLHKSKFFGIYYEEK